MFCDRYELLCFLLVLFRWLICDRGRRAPVGWTTTGYYCKGLSGERFENEDNNDNNAHITAEISRFYDPNTTRGPLWVTGGTSPWCRSSEPDHVSREVRKPWFVQRRYLFRKI